ncbi:hypothetical protein H8356DRAFT_1087402 [Neocallimastix lanati (nom. inval.)]|uniref:Uncharacterized protein n=1 Tax=Neocallimastix californiae TaxID=1754190 RepID=A0A1Y2D8L1_9FUNG|nr:hypothetical protein H8356DRAFT_1087402 [Neocallimastix sp. JGI-2020a]ORY55603.1 hypothetical protein LY90DRAFT_645686 [Neocallimastix californiae]|eukprot:ORY55603.1 hypothetical protein LY90DRAFT_645686 [Neocallimastix californiae]
MKENSAKIRIRGNSSAYYGDIEKILANPVPYKIKFDEKTSFLGLHEELLYNYSLALESDYLKTSPYVMYSVQSLVDWINGRISWMDKTYVPGTFSLPSQNEGEEVEEYTETSDESTDA